MDNAQKIWDRLISAGLTPAGAAGLLGNLYAESGLRPDNLQNTCEAKLGFTDEGYTVAVDNGCYANFANDGAGYGIAQWTYPTRKAGLLLQARIQECSIGDLDMQVAFLLQELQSLFPAVLNKLRTTSSVREASDCVLLRFERPADQSEAAKARRTGYAQMFYDQFVQMGGEIMSYLMTSAEICAKALNIADHYETAYMLGPWGWPANDKMITRATTEGSNAATNKQWLAKANAIKGRGFIFDCVGLIKGILWGWNGDLARVYGGAGYACNGVPDCDAKKMIDCCREVSTDFSGIIPGEAVWMDGHIGLYIGSGQVVEATPKWKGGVQKSTILNVSKVQISSTAGTRTWTKHGKLQWVDYSAADKPADMTTGKEIENMSKDELKAMIREIVKEVLNEENPVYKDLKDVPKYWQPTAAALMDAGAINGGTPAEVCATDLNLRKETLKAVVVSAMYHDARERVAAGE